MSTCLVVISSGNVHLRCAESVVRVVTEKAINWTWFHQAAPYLDDARNACIRAFNQEYFRDCDRLLMVDSDIEFTPDDVRLLEQDDFPIVSGVYHSAYDGHILPVVYDWGITQDAERRMGPVKRWSDCEFGEQWEQPIVVAAGVGAGFLMIKREVLDALEAIHGEPCPWFAEEIRNDFHLGEDLCFCLRAAEAGFVTHVDRRVQVAHHKGVRLGGHSDPVMG